MMLQFKNVFFILISLAALTLTGCKDNTFYGIEPEIELVSISAEQEELTFNVAVLPYEESHYIEGIGVCIGTTDSFPEGHNSIKRYSNYTYSAMSECTFEATPGEYYYIRPFVQTEDGYFYGEAKTYETPPVWEVFESEVLFGYSNRIIDIIHENDIRFFSRNKQYKSTDRGETWNVVSNNLPNNAVLFVEFFSPTEGLIVMDESDQAIYHTTDGGNYWTLVSSLGASEVNCGYFLSMETGFIATSGNRVRRSLDGGASWGTVILPIEDSDEVTVIFPADNDNVFIGTEEGSLYRSIDGGGSWTHMNPSSPFEDITDFYFFNSEHGYIIANEQIYETTNGGATRQSRFYEYNCIPLKITFLNDLEGFVVGKKGSSLRTVNGGVNWSIIADESNYPRPDTFINFDMKSSSFGMATTNDHEEVARYAK